MLRIRSPILARLARLGRAAIIQQKVWEKATIVPGCNPEIWRKDCCGAWLKRNQYGKRESPFGWEKDHVIPVSKGGYDKLYNLRPLNWQNNASRQAGRLICSVTSSRGHLEGFRKAPRKVAFQRRRRGKAIGIGNWN